MFQSPFPFNAAAAIPAAVSQLAGIVGYTIHGHRDTFAVGMARCGMPLGTLQKLLGHRDIRTTLIYASFAPAYEDVIPYQDAFSQQMGRLDDPIHAPPDKSTEKRGDRGTA